MNIRNRFSVVVTSLAGVGLIAGSSLLAGCPSQTQTQEQEQESAPTPVAQAAGFGGTVLGGRGPIVGATVVAYASGTTVGAAPTQIGTAITQSPGGSFTMTFSPAPRTGQVVYVAARGGNAGAGLNEDIGLMTVAGIGDSTLAPVAETVNINELTTVASAAALQDYIQFDRCSTITGNTQSGTCVAIPGALDLTNMAATVDNLVNVVGGTPSDFLLSQAAVNADFETTLEKMDTLANVLAGCVNSAGTTEAPSTACQNLADAAFLDYSDIPAAVWQVAANPAVTSRARTVFQLQPPETIFAPALTTVPAAVVPNFWRIGGQRFVFATDYYNNTVYAWRLNEHASLHENSGQLFDDGTIGVAVHPRSVAASGQYLYVPSNSNHTLSAYAIRSDGVLALKDTVTIAGQPWGVAVDSKGAYVYVTDSNQALVYAYKVGPDGTLDQIGTALSTGSGPNQLAVDPSGRYVYVATQNDGVYEYTIGADGTLSPNGQIAAGSEPFSITVDPAGPYVYVADYDGSKIYEYAINSNGTLSDNGNLSVYKPRSVAVDPTGTYAYVAGYGNNRIHMYTIGTDGTLSENGDPSYIAGGSRPFSAQVDPSGRYLYVTNYSGSNISEYQILNDGTLAASGTIGAGSQPYWMTIEPTGSYVYVANYGASTVSAYALDSDSLLTPVAGSPFAAEPEPESVAIDPRGRYAYVGNYRDGNVSAFAISPRGVLTPIAGSPFPAGALTKAVIVDPSGHYVYAANLSSDNVSEYKIEATGALSSIGAAHSIANPKSFAMYSRGDDEYLYVGGGSSAVDPAVTLYEFGSSGSLNQVDELWPSPMNMIVVDPFGPFFYTFKSDVIQWFNIQPDGSIIAPGGVNHIGTGYDAPCIVMDPAGRFMFVPSSDGTTWVYTIGADGALTYTFSSTGTGRAAVDPGGGYVFLVGASITPYTIGSDGALTPVAGSTFGAGNSASSVTVGP